MISAHFRDIRPLRLTAVQSAGLIHSFVEHVAFYEKIPVKCHMKCCHLWNHSETHN